MRKESEEKGVEKYLQTEEGRLKKGKRRVDGGLNGQKVGGGGTAIERSKTE